MPLTVNISKSLDQFDLRTRFSCPAGELVAIVGPSGSGKTTLLRIIAGLEQPDSGSIVLNGSTWTDTETGCHVPTHRRRIGLVFQDYTLFPHMTVRQNIAFGATSDALVQSLMDSFGINHLAQRKPASISGGERQRAAMCQALAREPALLMLDEPFSALDVQTRASLCSLLAEFKQRLDIPILHVTHDLGEADLLGDVVIALEYGKITPDWLGRQQPLHLSTPPTPSPVFS